MRRYSRVDLERSRKVRTFIKTVLRKYGVTLSKDLGQHFVVDRNLLNEMIKAVYTLSIRPVVFEIGTGIGLLTRELARRRKTYSIDIDFTLLRIAKREVLTGLDAELIGADALEFYPPKGSNVVVGNIPYSISGPLIYRLMEDRHKPPAVLTVQKEFAEKITAKPGTREATSTSVLLWNVYEPKIIASFPPESFFPRPKVRSAIIVLKPKPEKCNYRILKRLTKIAFVSPNRKLKNTLSSIMDVPKRFASKRPRELSLDERCELVRLYMEEYKDRT